MRINHLLLITILLLTNFVWAAAQTEGPPPLPIKYLNNNDVIRMVHDSVKPGDIISRILTSHCRFDIFPPVLQDLRRRGVPTTVLMAMKAAPSGPPAAYARSETTLTSAQVQIPSGTVVEVEAAFPVSSANVHKGDIIIFQVTRKVLVNDVLVVDREAIAKARVVGIRPAGRWGRAGMLAWRMEYVVAVDGSRIPIEVSGRIRGNNRSAAIAGGAVATGALIFPYTSPVGLIWGLKKGEEAILRGSKPFLAVVSTASEVAGIPPKNRRFYHDVGTVKASTAPPTPAQFDEGSFKAGGFRRN